ncbi:MAG: hypothetical protein R3B48_21255 [Kofleriaceae bacterium]
MAKTGLLALLFSITAILGVTTFSTEASAGDPQCKRTEFKTVSVKAACAKSQKVAKDEMKAFMRKAKFKKCQDCHSSLAPDYKLKEDGLKKYLDAGGK